MSNNEEEKEPVQSPDARETEHITKSDDCSYNK
jgi:hypothetical protein